VPLTLCPCCYALVSTCFGPQTRRANAKVRSLSNRVERLQKANAKLRLRVGRLQRGTSVQETKFKARMRGAVTRINYLVEQRDQVGTGVCCVVFCSAVALVQAFCSFSLYALVHNGGVRDDNVLFSAVHPFQLKKQALERDAYVAKLEAKLLQQSRALREYRSSGIKFMRRQQQRADAEARRRRLLKQKQHRQRQRQHQQQPRTNRLPSQRHRVSSADSRGTRSWTASRGASVPPAMQRHHDHSRQSRQNGRHLGVSSEESPYTGALPENSGLGGREGGGAVTRGEDLTAGGDGLVSDSLFCEWYRAQTGRNPVNVSPRSLPVQSLA